MSTPFHAFRRSSDSVGAPAVGAGDAKDEMDVGISVKEADAQMHSDSSSDTNPGELTFEEGTMSKRCVFGNMF
jgi:hypothetical protein